MVVKPSMDHLILSPVVLGLNLAHDNTVSQQINAIRGQNCCIIERPFSEDSNPS